MEGGWYARFRESDVAIEFSEQAATEGKEASLYPKYRAHVAPFVKGNRGQNLSRQRKSRAKIKLRLKMPRQGPAIVRRLKNAIVRGF